MSKAFLMGLNAGRVESIPEQKEEQEKTVSNPNFSAGDVVVTPDANKVLSKATVKKDANLVAGNIKEIGRASCRERV